MKNIKETCDQLLQNPLDKNLFIARMALDSLLSVLPNETKEQRNMSNWIIVGLCFNIISSDNEIDQKEADFFNALMSTDYNPETIKSKLGLFQNETQSLIENIQDYKDDIRDNFLLLAILFTIADGKIAKEELAVLEKINSGSEEESYGI